MTEEGHTEDFLSTRNVVGTRVFILSFLFKRYVCLVHCSKWIIHVPLSFKHAEKLGWDITEEICHYPRPIFILHFRVTTPV